MVSVLSVLSEPVLNRSWVKIEGTVRINDTSLIRSGSTVSWKQIQVFQEYENQLKKLKAEYLFGFKLLLCGLLLWRLSPCLPVYRTRWLPGRSADA